MPTLKLNKAPEPEEESPKDYRKGGYHPVHIGDHFSHLPGSRRPRYQVVQKLGFGSYATVWLARDHNPTANPKYVVLKITTSDGASSKEITVMKWIKRQRKDHHPGHRYVGTLLDSFKFVGPNGKHDVIVLPLMVGLRELGIEFNENFDIPWPWLSTQRKKFAHQAAMGVAYLHSIELSHGDLHLGNFAATVPNIDKQLDMLQDDPDFKPKGKKLTAAEMRSSDGGEGRKPQIIYKSWNVMKCIKRQFFEDADYDDIKVQIIDFGAATRRIDYPPISLVPTYVRPPEFLFQYEAAKKDERYQPETREIIESRRLTSDIWSLACCLYEIMCEGQALIPYWYKEFSETVECIRRLCGPVPFRWQRYYRPRFYPLRVHDTRENWRSLTYEAYTLFKRTGMSPDARSALREANLMSALLIRMFRWESRDRITADEALHSGWFKQLTDLEYEHFAAGNPRARRAITIESWTKPRCKFAPVRHLPTLQNKHRMVTRSKKFQKQSGIPPRPAPEHRARYEISSTEAVVNGGMDDEDVDMEEQEKLAAYERAYEEEILRAGYIPWPKRTEVKRGRKKLPAEEYLIRSTSLANFEAQNRGDWRNN